MMGAMGVLQNIFPVEQFHLDVGYFPEATKELFSVDLILKHGALALGFKTESSLFKSQKFLNIGLLNPKSRDCLTQLQAEAKQKLGTEGFTGTHIYRLRVGEFLQVLHVVYGLEETAVRSRNPEKLSPALVAFFEKQKSEENPASVP